MIPFSKMDRRVVGALSVKRNISLAPEALPWTCRRTDGEDVPTPSRELLLSQNRFALLWEYTPLTPANTIDPAVKAVAVPVPPEVTAMVVPVHVPVVIVPSVVIDA